MFRNQNGIFRVSITEHLLLDNRTKYLDNRTKYLDSRTYLDIRTTILFGYQVKVYLQNRCSVIEALV